MIEPENLPYHDTTPTGAADFYFAINATFRFIRNKLGNEGLINYWRDLGHEYMAPVSQRWKEGGLHSVAAYWRSFFSAEPDAQISVGEAEDRVVLDVLVCPAIRHLRLGARVVEPGFCQHCYFVSEAAAQAAGFTIRVKGGNGCCRQTFFRNSALVAAQRLEDIAEVL